jgi:hypothetical protein
VLTRIESFWIWSTYLYFFFDSYKVK